MTPTQETQQCVGPNQVTAETMALLFKQVPRHHKIVALSVNGQSGAMTIETMHEGLEHVHVFPREDMAIFEQLAPAQARLEDILLALSAYRAGIATPEVVRNRASMQHEATKLQGRVAALKEALAVLQRGREPGA